MYIVLQLRSHLYRKIFCLLVLKSPLSQSSSEEEPWREGTCSRELFDPLRIGFLWFPWIGERETARAGSIEAKHLEEPLRKSSLAPFIIRWLPFIILSILCNYETLSSGSAKFFDCLHYLLHLTYAYNNQSGFNRISCFLSNPDFLTHVEYWAILTITQRKALLTGKPAFMDTFQSSWKFCKVQQVDKYFTLSSLTFLCQFKIYASFFFHVKAHEKATSCSLLTPRCLWYTFLFEQFIFGGGCARKQAPRAWSKAATVPPGNSNVQKQSVQHLEISHLVTFVLRCVVVEKVPQKH